MTGSSRRRTRRAVLRTGTGIAGILGTATVAGCIGGNDPEEDDDRDPDVTCEQTDAEQPIEVDELPGMDAPPQTVASPEVGAGEWDELYLGRCMDTEPSLDFEPQRASGERILQPRVEDGYWVGMATDASHGQELLAGLDLEVDFEAHIAIAVHSPGSPSLRHEWTRVEEITDGIHLHGYVVRPHSPIPQDTTLESVVSVARPDPVPELARVSLTLSEHARIHFDTAVSPVAEEDLAA